MRKTIGTPIHHDHLEPGKIYYLKHDALGEAEVEYLGAQTFLIKEGLLRGKARKKSWGKGEYFVPPNFDGAQAAEM